MASITLEYLEFQQENASFCLFRPVDCAYILLFLFVKKRSCIDFLIFVQIMELLVFTMLEFCAKTSKGHLNIIRIFQVRYFIHFEYILSFINIREKGNKHKILNSLGLEINEARPHDKLPYRGAWLWVGSEMIHLMELPNPDPLTGRPEHGGRDRHTCIAIRDVSKLKMILDKAGKLSTSNIIWDYYLHGSLASNFSVLFCRYFLYTQQIRKAGYLYTRSR